MKTKSKKAKGSSDLEDILNKRDSQFGMLSRLSAVIPQAESLEKGLEEALGNLLVLTGADVGTVHILDAPTGELRLIAGRGVSDRFSCAEKNIPVGDCLCGEVARMGRMQVSNELNQDPLVTRTACELENFGSVLSIPLKSREQVLGIFTVYAKESYHFSGIDRDLLLLLGNQVGIAVQNANLYSRTREKAVSEERGFMAQEIHDSVAQSLAYLNLQSKQLEDLLKSGSSEKAIREVATLRQVILDTYKDVRQLMVDFRTGMNDEGNLVRAINAYVQDFSHRTGLRATFEIDSTDVNVDPVAQVQLFRIVQEALSNVRKHADASFITVQLVSDSQKISIKISDDGKGFDPNASLDVHELHIGLKIMRERAARFQGSVEVKSGKGNGTTLLITLPLQGINAG